MICNRCEKEIPDSSRFCKYCGNTIESAYDQNSKVDLTKASTDEAPINTDNDENNQATGKKGKKKAPKVKSKPGGFMIFVAILLSLLMIVTNLISIDIATVKFGLSDDNVRKIVQDTDISKLDASFLKNMEEYSSYDGEKLDEFLADFFFTGDILRGFSLTRANKVKLVDDIISNKKFKSFAAKTINKMKNGFLWGAEDVSIKKADLYEAILAEITSYGTTLNDGNNSVILEDSNLYLLAVSISYLITENDISEFNDKMDELQHSYAINLYYFLYGALAVSVLMLILIAVIWGKKWRSTLKMLGTDCIVTAVLGLAEMVAGIVLVLKFIPDLKSLIFSVGLVLGGISAGALLLGIILLLIAKIGKKKAVAK